LIASLIESLIESFIQFNHQSTAINQQSISNQSAINQQSISNLQSAISNFRR